MSNNLNLTKLLSYPELPDQLTKVEKQLGVAVKTDNLLIQTSCLRLIKAGGKRLRPALIIFCSQLAGGKVGQSTIPLAAAVELAHVGSLAHDDIIDESDTRRGEPTINSLEGTNHAILVGDFLLAAACSEAAAASSEAARAMAEAIKSLCAGQGFELDDQTNPERSVSNYLQTVANKTAALMAASCYLGGLQANLNLKQKQALYDFGFNFGMAFQLIDDVMDLVSTEELYGKPVGSDLKEGTYTLPILLGMQTKDESKLKAIIKSGKIDGNLVQILINNQSISKTMQKIYDYNLSAANSLKSLSTPAAKKLSQLPDAYTDWTIDNLVAEPYKLLLKRQ